MKGALKYQLICNTDSGAATYSKPHSPCIMHVFPGIYLFCLLELIMQTELLQKFSIMRRLRAHSNIGMHNL